MTVPEPLRKQVREGRALAMEVPAPEARRAFVVIRPEGGAPTLEESLRRAHVEGVVPSATAFVLTHHEYDSERLDGWDYDVGRVCHAEVRVDTLEQAESVLSEWGFDPALLLRYSKTDAP